MGSIENKTTNYYVVNKGDTLSAISQRLTGRASNYKALAEANGIADPNKIRSGQILKIPIKFDRPLKRQEIPTKNKTQVIDNYSPNYDYIIEQDKVYYSQRGKDHWVDISDNDKARANLYNFIGNKYGFKGYEDDEKNIQNRVNSGNFNYKAYRDSVNSVPDRQEPLVQSRKPTSVPIKKNISPPKAQQSRKPTSVPIKKNISPPKAQQSYIALSDNTRVNKPVVNPYQQKSINLKEAMNAPKEQPVEIEDPDSFLNIGNWFTKLGNWVDRRLAKSSSKPEDTSNLKFPELTSKDSMYGLRPGTFTGDTINVDKRRYFLPESMDVNEYTFGIRNRGQNKPINSEAAPITAFFPFDPFGKHDKKFKTYIGINKDGKLTVGDISQFSEGSYLAGTYANNIISFKKDNQGNQLWKAGERGNGSRNVPIVKVLKEDGTVGNGSVNVLTGKTDNKGITYGNITGGRVLAKVGSELRLLSGSISDIEQQFEEMKKRNKVDYGTFYTLDNGSYNRGLRTYDKQFTRQDLIDYDLQNDGGGNFLYLKDRAPLVFQSDTIQTPNVRTVNDESYKKGHGLVNERKGVVLHHTAFMDEDLTGVTNHLTRPGGESSHVIIGYDGTRKVLARPEQVTFHAGHSVWNNRDNVNDFMLGLEFQGDTNKKPLTDQQIQSAVEYLKPILRENNISLENITSHQKVRDNYNEYAKKQRAKSAPHKPDINERDYNRIIQALLEDVYYKK